MPRAAYNVLAEVFWGSGTGTPNVSKGIISGRLVADNHVADVGGPFGDTAVYFTTDSTVPFAGVWIMALPQVTWFMDSHDYLEIPPGSGSKWTVYQVMQVTPLRSGLTPYYRLTLLPGVF